MKSYIGQAVLLRMEEGVERLFVDAVFLERI